MTPHVSISLLLTQSDDRLVRMTAAGHDRAFEAIVDRYRRPLLRYAERFPAAGPAEDVVQAAFVRAWGALREGTAVRDLRPWLYRIVHNTALNAMKRSGGDNTELIEAEDPSCGPESEVEIQEDLRRTLGGIAALPNRQRSALVAVAVDGRPHADVGRELGITEPAVRQLVRRARATVRAAASALTPYPLMAWIAQAGGDGVAVSRIGEIVGGAGTGALVLKLGTVAATTGALVVGVPQAEHAIRAKERRASERQVAQLSAKARARRAAASAPAGATNRHALSTSDSTLNGTPVSRRSGGATTGARSVAGRRVAHTWAPGTGTAATGRGPATSVNNGTSGPGNHTPQPGTTGAPAGPTGMVDAIAKHRHSSDRHKSDHVEKAEAPEKDKATATQPDDGTEKTSETSERATDERDGAPQDATIETLKSDEQPKPVEQPEGPQAPPVTSPGSGATGAAGSVAP